MVKTDKNEWEWKLILGETEILDKGEIYTLVVGYVSMEHNAPQGPYIRLWGPNGKFISGSWVHDIVNCIKNSYFEAVDADVVRKCLDFAYRVEKLRAFA